MLSARMCAKFLARLSLRVYNELNVVPERRLAPRRSSDLRRREREATREQTRLHGGARAEVAREREAELKYQGAGFARKRNVRRFSGLRKKSGMGGGEQGAGEDARRNEGGKCAVVKEVVSSRRCDGRFE